VQIKFPPKFRFGIADADLQVIGEDNTRKYENSTPTMWSYFAKNSGKCYKNQTSGTGVDRYHRWREDIEIMKKMGIKHYRTSVSMSRVLKKNGEVNSQAIEWYTQYFKALKTAGITIYATLYHWELPQYLNAQGGWTNRKNIEYLEKHAKAVAQNLGEFIEEYFILNEPWVSSILSYYFGVHAPGEKNLKGALLAAHNLLLSLGLAYKALSSLGKNIKISTVFNSEPAYAYSTDPKDVLAAKYADGYFNRWFMDPMFLGKYPSDMVKLYENNMPKISQEDMKLIKVGSKLYSFGLNYYCGQLVKYSEKSDLKFEKIIKKGSLTNDLGWPIFLPPLYQEGLYDMLRQVYHSYKDYGLRRIYITENGMAQKTPWDGKSKIISDERRIHYLREHIRQVYKAITRGIPVEGYFAWTLMDNYEWAEGYRPESCFGLIHVERKTMKRVWKKSALWYKQLINTYVLQE